MIQLTYTGAAWIAVGLFGMFVSAKPSPRWPRFLDGITFLANLELVILYVHQAVAR